MGTRQGFADTDPYARNMTMDAFRDFALLANPVIFKLTFLLGLIFVPVIMTGTILKHHHDRAGQMNRAASVIAGSVCLLMAVQDVLTLAIDSGAVVAACIGGAFVCGGLGILGIASGLRRA